MSSPLSSKFIATFVITEALMLKITEIDELIAVKASFFIELSP